MAIDRDTTRDWMTCFAGEMAEHRQELVRLETAIGDGDHGRTLIAACRRRWRSSRRPSSLTRRAVLKTVAMALVSSVGGAAGPLYGTLFLQMGTALAGQSEVDLPTFAAAWRKGMEGVQSRGKAQPGDKTMLEALLPAVEALEQASDLDGGLQLRRSRPPSRGCTRRRRSSRARDGPATWVSAARITRTLARPPRTTSSRAPPKRWRTERTHMPKYSVALDQGTTSSRAMVFDHSGQRRGGVAEGARADLSRSRAGSSTIRRRSGRAARR